MQRTQISLNVEERRLLDIESRRSGRSMSALIRDAIRQAYGASRDIEADLRVIDEVAGSWEQRPLDGEEFVEGLRSGRRLSERAR